MSSPPPHDVRLYFSGRKLRYETQLLTHKDRGFTGFESLISGFDGEVDWSLVGTHEKTVSAEGHLRGRAEYNDIETITMRPWTLFIRPMHPLIWNPRVETYAVETEDVSVNDRPCVAVRERAGVSGELRRRLWLDRERKYVVVRYTQDFKGQVGSLVNIEYREHPEFGWIPAKWNTNWYGNDGKLYDATEAMLSDAQFNFDLAAELFAPHFAAGTKVYDQRQDGRAFIALGNGELRPYTNDDDHGKWRLPVPGWMIAATAFFGLIVLLLWRRSRLQSG